MGPSLELFYEYTEHEERLISRFNAHPFFARLPQLRQGKFEAYLLQLQFFTRCFVDWGEQAKAGLIDPYIQELARHILRGEIPTTGPSHRELLSHALKQIGVFPFCAFSTPQSQKTKECLARQYELIKLMQSYYDLRTLVALRVCGEIAVTEICHHIVPELSRHYNLAPEESVFYAPHAGGMMTNTGSFDRLLSRKIEDQKLLNVARETAAQSLKIYYDFHDQFS